MAELKDISLFLLDMDGTVNLGFDPIDGAEDFLDEVRKQGKNYIFLTNNSSRNAGDYVEKMRKLGFFCERENVFTSGMAAGLFLKKNKPDARVYVCGTKVCALLSEGADYYATNVDMVCPIEGGRYLPDCGSFADMFYNAVKRRPVFLGKPDRTMIDIVLEKTNTPYEKAAMVGDRIYTDVKTGVNAGITSVLVLSGEKTKKDAEESDVCPTYILDSVRDIYNIIKDER